MKQKLVISTVFDKDNLCAVKMESLIDRNNSDLFFNSYREGNGWVHNLDGIKEFYCETDEEKIFIFRYPNKDFVLADYITLYTLVGATQKKSEVRFVKYKEIDEIKYRDHHEFKVIDHIDYMDALTKDALRLGWLYDTYSQKLRVKSYMDSLKYMPPASEVDIYVK